MTLRLQVAVDCRDPHALNKFWAEVLGYEVERDDGFIQRMLDQGMATADDVIEVDGAHAWKTAAACHDPKGVGPRMLFQQVPELKTVKNRWHLDLHVGDDRRASEIERLKGLGATFLWDGREGPMTWVTMADPEGNEFCVA